MRLPEEVGRWERKRRRSKSQKRRGQQGAPEMNKPAPRLACSPHYPVTGTENHLAIRGSGGCPLCVSPQRRGEIQRRQPMSASSVTLVMRLALKSAAVNEKVRKSGAASRARVVRVKQNTTRRNADVADWRELGWPGLRRLSPGHPTAVAAFARMRVPLSALSKIRDSFPLRPHYISDRAFRRGSVKWPTQQ